jgi:hypothetical protein
LNTIFAADCLGHCDGRVRTTFGNCRVQSRKVNTRRARVTANHAVIFQVLAQDEVGFKEFLV